MDCLVFSDLLFLSFSQCVQVYLILGSMVVLYSHFFGCRCNFDFSAPQLGRETENSIFLWFGIDEIFGVLLVFGWVVKEL